MADVSRLGSAFGKVASTMLSIKQEEKRQRIKQEQIDTSNSLIQEALSLDKKLASNDTTPFLRNKRVFEHISKRENEMGLPTGTALGTYKKFFGPGATGSAAGTTDINKLPSRTIPGVGTEYWDANTGFKKFIPFDESLTNAGAIHDQNQKYGDELQKEFTDLGIFNKLSPKGKIDMRTNPESMATNPITAQAFRDFGTKKKMENEIERQVTAGKHKTASVVKTWRDNNTPDIIKNAVFGLIDVQNGDSSITPGEINAKLDRFLVDFQNHPEAYKTELKPLVTELRQLLTESHPDNKKAYTQKVYKSELEHTKDTIAMVESVSKFKMYQASPELIPVKIFADMVRGMNGATMTALTTGTELTSNTIYTAMGDALKHDGVEGYLKKEKAYTVRLTKAFIDLDLKTEKLKDSEAVDIIRNLSMLSVKEANTSAEMAKLYQGINWIRSDKKTVRIVSDQIDKFISEVLMADATANNQIYMLTSLKNKINME